MKTAGPHQDRNGSRAQREGRGGVVAEASGALEQAARDAEARHASGEQAVDLKREASNMLELAGSQPGAFALLVHSSRAAQAVLRQF